MAKFQIFNTPLALVTFGLTFFALAHSGSSIGSPKGERPSEAEVALLKDSMGSMACEEWWFYWHAMAFQNREGDVSLAPKAPFCESVRHRFYGFVQRLPVPSFQLLTALERRRPALALEHQLARELGKTAMKIKRDLRHLKNEMGQALLVLANEPSFVYTLPKDPGLHPNLFDVHITSLPISAVTLGTIYPLFTKRYQIDKTLNPPTVAHLVHSSKNDLLSVYGVGPKMVAEVEEGLAAHGLQLATLAPKKRPR